MSILPILLSIFLFSAALVGTGVTTWVRLASLGEVLV